MTGHGFWQGFADSVQESAVDALITSFAFTAVSVAASNIMKCFQCFKEGTLVETEDGLKPIEEIEVGDKVLAYDEETGEQAYKKVVRLFRNTTEEWYHIHVNGEEIVCTGGHPFYVASLDKFIPARELKVGNTLLLSGGTCVIIKEIQVEKLSKPQTTYNFEVEDYHTYYVSESKILTHNKCWRWGDGGRGTVDNNIDYHYEWHGEEVGAVDRADYIQLSYDFADEIVENGITSKWKISGATKNIFRYVYDGYYIDMDITKRLMVSFGMLY